jgi:amino acid transporter
MTARGLWFFNVSASAPMTVLAGGVLATLATTGVIGVPLAFAVLTVGLWVMTVGYVLMSRTVVHAAPFYALLAHGLGRAWGVAGGFVAFLAYNTMEISLFGLLGATVAGDLGGPWWLWAAVAWAVVAVCGALRVDISGTLLSILLMTEIAVIAVFDLGAFTHPATGQIAVSPMHPGHLFINGVGGVFALSLAAFVGYETAPAFTEEARTDRTAGRTTLAALLVLGPFYALSSWALVVAVGPGRVVGAARTDPDLPFTVMAQTLGVFGPLISDIARLLLVTSIFAAILSFHNTVARYTFAMSRERVFAARLARTGGGVVGRDAPIGGSLLQSGIAAAVIAVFAVVGVDPVAVMFTWLATLSAVAILTLLTAVCLAAFLFFIGGGGPGMSWARSLWIKAVTVTGVVLGVLGSGVTVANLGTLLGVPTGSGLTDIIPAVIVAAAVAGLVWAGVLRIRDAAVYEAIGRGRPHTLARPDARLNGVLR